MQDPVIKKCPTNLVPLRNKGRYVTNQVTVILNGEKLRAFLLCQEDRENEGRIYQNV